MSDSPTSITNEANLHPPAAKVGEPDPRHSVPLDSRQRRASPGFFVAPSAAGSELFRPGFLCGPRPARAMSGHIYGQVYPSVFGAQPFFSVSRRLERNGEFVGVIEASVLPSNFFRFFATLAYGGGQQYALIRNDGLILARYPGRPAGSVRPPRRERRISPDDRAIAAWRSVHIDIADRSHRAAFRLPPFWLHPALSDVRYRDSEDME